MFTGLIVLGEILGFARGLDLRLQDAFLTKQRANSDIVIVAIDNKSIQELGVWPWPREFHAELIDKLLIAQVEAIGYDVTFSETSNTVSDQALADSLARAKEKTHIVLAGEAVIELNEETGFQATSLLLPLAQFADLVDGFGPTTLLPDADGVVRAAPLAVQKNGELVAFFAPVITEQEVVSQIYQIPFVGDAGSYSTVSFVDVLKGRVEQNVLAHKLVLVGATAPDLHDEYLTPFRGNGATPGVEIQANIIQGLRQAREIMSLSTTERSSLIFLLGLLVIGLSAVLRLRLSIAINSAMLLAYFIVAFALTSEDILLPGLMPVTLLIGLTGVDIIARYKEEFSRRAFVQKAFGHYISPKMVEQLVQGDVPLELGGVKKELSILFSDIRGFTSLSEKLSPEELVSLLNEYLDTMTQVILEEEGTVDKYIGDAIMAFWGAPIPVKNHHEKAVRAALRMKHALAELQRRWALAGKPKINIGIGINSGLVVVGNIGSTKRFDYTVIGDNVNLASRLEGLTKLYELTLLITQATRQHLPENIVTRPIDFVAVKGKKEPVRIFEVVGYDQDIDQATKHNVAKFSEAMQFYSEKNFTKAKKIFVVLSRTGDVAAALFVERCDEYLKNPPGEEWNGVFVAKDK